MMKLDRQRILLRSYSVVTLFFVLLLLCPGPPPLFAVDFTYDGSDCNIIYRFIPNTGTLNDLTVIYNGSYEFYPSFQGGITIFILKGEILKTADEKHTSELLEETIRGNKYKAKFRWTYQGKSFVFNIRIWLQGKTLTMNFFTSSMNEKIVEFDLDRSEQTPDPKIIGLPYGHNVLYTNGIFISTIIDPFLSNASTIFPQHDYVSDTSASFGCYARYNNLTDGSRNNLRETIHITVSPEVSDTFFQVPNPISPYRDFLSDKVIVDLWRNSFSDYRDDLETLASMGLKDLFALFHVWQKYGYDNGLPTTFPSGKTFGGEPVLREVLDVCESNEYLFAFHTNYVDFYENSDVWNPEDIALNSDGSWIEAWYNPSTGIQSYLMKPSRCRCYASLYEPLIHNTYRTRAAFLDVHSSVLPSFKVDYDAGTTDAGRQASTFDAYTDLIDYARNVHSGPVAGEGVGFSSHIWAGYIDAIEADPRRRKDIFEERGGTDVPLIVDYKLKVLHDLFVPHGAGYLERFYLNKWSNYMKKELERYRITEIAFGNAGFLSNPLAKGISKKEILREYCFLKHLQKFFLTEKPKEIFYRVDDHLLPLSDALRRILPTTPADNLNSTLNKELNMLKIIYSDGFTIYVNRSTSGLWEIIENSLLYILPPNGFLAVKDDEFLAYSAFLDGEKKDYIYPAECICCGSILPPLNFAGKKVMNRSLFQVEYIHVLSWQPNPENMNIVKYRIYQVEVDSQNLLVELSADMSEYWHRNVIRDRPYTYALVAVNDENCEGDPAILTIR